MDSPSPGRKRARLETGVFSLQASSPSLAPAGLAAVLPLVGPAATHTPQVRISVSRSPPSSATPSEAEWVPEFTHQCFPLPLTKHADPLLRIWYRDPDLAWCGAFSSTAGSLEEDIYGMLELVTPDESRPSLLLREAPDVLRWPDLSTLPPPPPPAASWSPPGVCVASYAAAGLSFVVHRWALDSPALRAYHDRMSTLGPWLIETASRVNTADPRWTVFGVFQRRGEEGEGGGAAFSFVGYATVYTFTNPMRRERPDVLRLAQVRASLPVQRRPLLPPSAS
jgi:hypothetical protein